jgi:hypothetical protein
LEYDIVATGRTMVFDLVALWRYMLYLAEAFRTNGTANSDSSKVYCYYTSTSHRSYCSWPCYVYSTASFATLCTMHNITVLTLLSLLLQEWRRRGQPIPHPVSVELRRELGSTLASVVQRSRAWTASAPRRGVTWPISLHTARQSTKANVRALYTKG